MMTVREIDYRGSKAVAPLSSDKSVIVKEQRVDGIYGSKLLRCTLMGFERNYKVRFLSNQINKYPRRYSCVNMKHNLTNDINSGFISGFSDGESSFTVTIHKDSIRKTG